MITATRKGKYRIVDHSAQMMAGYDDEEDVTITGANHSCTTGAMGSGIARSDLVCLGIHNYGAAAATVRYVLVDSPLVARTVLVNSGDTFAPMPPIDHTVTAGSTANATVKLLYWDKRNYLGDGIMQRDQTYAG